MGRRVGGQIRKQRLEERKSEARLEKEREEGIKRERV